jgi:ABC-type antimicrobial peptide transport system permease subunit
MIFSYFILAWRNLTANKTVSCINIFGLSIAVACCVTVFLFLSNYWTLDSFHTNSDRIFIVEYKTEVDGQTQIWGDAPSPMSHALSQDFPQVERTVRVSREGVIVSSGEHTFNELVTYTDTGFFQMFTFPLTLGNPVALKDPSAIILSAEIAEKYFHGEMPLGRSIRLITSNQEKKIFTVQGVAAPFPDNASLRFDFLVGYSPAMSIKATEDWTKRGDGIFVQLRQPTDAALLTDQMSRYLPLFNSHNQATPATAFVLDNLKNPISKAYDINQRPAEAAHPLLAAMMAAIALLLLLLSCFNYVNISLGAATRRLKEIGIRKVMGGQRRQLIGQFMAENLLLCTLSLVLGLAFCQTIFAPMMNGLIVNIHLSISFSKNPDLWLFLIGLLGLTALASGAYPAFYISAFRPTAIFSGKQKFGHKSTFRRVLLSTQFGLAFVAIMLSVVLLAAGKHWSKMAWGYDPSQTWVVQLTDSTQYGLLKNELLKQPNVQSISGASLHVGLGSDREEIKVGEVTTPVRRYNVGASYANTLGLQLQAGRFFEEHRTVEDEQSVVVNETFVKKQGWDNAIGQQIRVGEKQYRITGVLKDFKMLGTGAINPAMFFCEKEKDFSFLVVRYAAGSGQQVADQTIQDYLQLFNSAPISHFFQQEVFDGFNRTFWSVAKSFGYIAGLALLIACLGLYGLATQQYARRMKEVSVRKLLGASVGQIVLLVNREFVFMLLLAGGISTALCYFVFQLVLNQLDQFVGTYRPGILPFLLANLLVFVTAALAIGQHSWRLAKVQLGEVLKNSE